MVQGEVTQDKKGHEPSASKASVSLRTISSSYHQIPRLDQDPSYQVTKTLPKPTTPSGLARMVG